MKDEKIYSFIINELSIFNFKTYTKGFKYLKESIFICIKDTDALNNLNKKVFPNIAIKYNEKSYIHVKWCIEQVLKTMYLNTDIKILSDYFKINSDLKPSLKFIIYTIVCKYEWKFNKQ